MNRPDISQDRIGVHPNDWKLSAADEAILRDVDDGIRPFMRLMLAGGFETYESCQGYGEKRKKWGGEHSYAEPTIAFHGGRSEGPRAIAWLQAHGVEPRQLNRFWSILDGEMVGPDWQVVFAPAPKSKVRR